MAYWLIKTNPEVFSWDMLVKSGKTRWDGVRNYQARNFMREMNPDDSAIIFHQGAESAAVGIAKIVTKAYDDPNASEGNWSVIDIEPIMPFTRQVSQDEIRYTPVLNVLQLFNQPRLSIMPMTQPQWDLLLRIGKTALPA